MWSIEVCEAMRQAVKLHYIGTGDRLSRKFPAKYVYIRIVSIPAVQYTTIAFEPEGVMGFVRQGGTVAMQAAEPIKKQQRLILRKSGVATHAVCRLKRAGRVS